MSTVHTAAAVAAHGSRQQPGKHNESPAPDADSPQPPYGAADDADGAQVPESMLELAESEKRSGYQG
eukprot:gene10206-1411_t